MNGEKVITYDIGDHTYPDPEPGDFVVSMVNRGYGIGSIYHILKSRKVYGNTPGRFALMVLVANDMKDDCYIHPESRLPIVRGKVAFPLYWHSRNKKKQKLFTPNQDTP